MNITCSSQCAWDWPKFFINGNPIAVGNGTTSGYIIHDISNEVQNCPGCNIPAQQDCTDSDQGPVYSIVHVTFSASGEYYINCLSYLFDLNSPNWPNEVFDVYSRILKIKVMDESGQYFIP